MVTTHWGQLSWLIKIRYSKIVVMETGIWASPDTIKIQNFIGMLFPLDEKWPNESRTNEQRV